MALVTFFALVTSWINWGFSLVFSAVLALEVARRVRGVDYRALAAASFLGIGSIWAQGLSGSAALQMASPGALQPQIRDIVAERRAGARGDHPVPQHDLPLAEPRLGRRRDRRRDDGDVVRHAAGATRAHGAPISASRCPTKTIAPEITWPGTPGTWLEHSPILTWLVVALGGTFLVRYFMAAPEPLNALTLNIINLSFLLVGMLLHRTPARLMRAVQDATPAVWGVILQFPFYAGIAGIITGTHLSQQLASAFVQISTPTTFPAVVAVYSAVLGVFVPSGGSKWVIEAPYVMEAAHALKVHLGWIVAAYDLGEALANLVQPFWMLPILGIFRLGARDVMGYTLVVFIALVPTVLLLVTLLGRTLSYPL